MANQESMATSVTGPRVMENWVVILKSISMQVSKEEISTYIGMDGSCYVTVWFHKRFPAEKLPLAER